MGSSLDGGHLLIKGNDSCTLIVQAIKNQNGAQEKEKFLCIYKCAKSITHQSILL